MTLFSHRLRGILVACAAFGVTTGASADEATLRQAEALLNTGRHADALTLLEPLQLSLAGDTRYDYLLGLAFLESGEPGKAVLALQRVEIEAPHFVGARLELARAYYASGQLDLAEKSFRELGAMNPPPAAQKAIRDYVALIDSRKRRLRMEFRLGGRVGYDSNANSATAANSFLGFDLLENSREKSSPFTEFSATAAIAKPLRRGLLLDTRINVRRRDNPDASFVDSTVADVSVGVRKVTERSSRSLRIQTYRVGVDGDTNNEGLALAGSWDYAWKRNLRLGIFGRVGRVRYDDALKVKDVDQSLLGATVSWAFGPGREGSLGGSLLAGVDNAVRSGSRYDRTLYGIRLNAGWAFSNRIRAAFTAGRMQSDYDAVFFEQQFSAPREDTLSQAAVSLYWQFSPLWQLVHAVAYTNNDTDIDVFAYERVETSLSFSRAWR